jgi:hypothetical protein
VFAVEVSIDLPFFLRLKDSFIVRYDRVCQESQLKELLGKDVQITFSRKPAGTIDKGEWPKERSTVAIKVETPARLSDNSVGTFAIQNCLEIVNRIITSYQATTGEVSNAGFIFPLGTSDMQLFADIRVNGQDIRDRWPSHSINTFPLPKDKIVDFERYLADQAGLPLSMLFLTNAILSLERGQHPVAVLQGAFAVELRITQVIRDKLQAAGWSDKAIEPYERLTLGVKLQIPQTDPRSLETYFNGASGFADVYKKVSDDLTPLRNNVVHRGYLASHLEANRAVEIAREFLKIVN